MSAEAALCVDAAHPSLPGHFPGAPVVPGVVLLSEVLAEQRRRVPHVRVLGVKKLKFLRMLLPGQPFTVEFGTAAAGNLRFKCRQGGALLAEGNFALSPAAAAESTAPGVRQRV